MSVWDKCSRIQDTPQCSFVVHMDTLCREVAAFPGTVAQSALCFPEAVEQLLLGQTEQYAAQMRARGITPPDLDCRSASALPASSLLLPKRGCWISLYGMCTALQDASRGVKNAY